MGHVDFSKVFLERDEYKRRFEDLVRRARGNWTGILESIGADKNLTEKKNIPCPWCGGTDRFQYCDYKSDGNWYCRKCEKSGGGFHLVMKLLDMKATHTLLMLEEKLGVLQANGGGKIVKSDSAKLQRMLLRLVNECRPITRGDPVDVYFRNLGIDLEQYPQSLLYHPQLEYWEEDGSQKKVVGRFPGLVAKVQGEDDSLVALHRTYLYEGSKAEVPSPKKVLGPSNSGGAVRFSEPDGTLSAGEGLENSIAVFKRRGDAVWSGLNACNLEKLWVPPRVKLLSIYGDNDADGDFTGQVAAYRLAQRFVRSVKDNSRRAEVFIPKRAGSDWKEVMRKKVHLAVV